MCAFPGEVEKTTRGEEHAEFAPLWGENSEGQFDRKHLQENGEFPPLHRVPTEAQRSGFGGKRTNDRTNELCRLRRSEECVVREDDSQHRVCLVCGNAAALPSAQFPGRGPDPLYR